MSYELLVMAGEGIGLEIIPQAMRIVERINDVCNLSVECTEYEVGKLCYQKYGCYLSPKAAEHCEQIKSSSKAAILFGAVSGEPLTMLRKKNDLFANIRSIKIMNALHKECRLKINDPSKIDLCIVRELTSGLYYGREKKGFNELNQRFASQEMYYSEPEIERIGRIAFELAETRKRRVTLVHKNNAIKGVFDLWLDVCKELAKAFQAVQFDNIYVDNMAMQMVLAPTEFDILLCSNLFGDILSDLGAGIVGSIGVLASISKNAAGFSLYEGIGGTAPDISGQGKANPIAAILSVALFYRYTVMAPKIADQIELAVNNTLLKFRTVDIKDECCQTVSTVQLTDQILKNLDKVLC